MEPPNDFAPVLLCGSDALKIYNALVHAGEKRLADQIAKAATRTPEDDAFVGGLPHLDENEFDVDDQPIISRGDDGAYVNVWCWVSNEMAGLDSTIGDERVDIPGYGSE